MDVKKFLIEFFSRRVPKEKIDPEADIFENGDIDSLGGFELITSLEKEFGITFTEEDFQDRRFKTINGIAQIVKEKSEMDPQRIDDTFS